MKKVIGNKFENIKWDRIIKGFDYQEAGHGEPLQVI